MSPTKIVTNEKSKRGISDSSKNYSQTNRSGQQGKITPKSNSSKKNSSKK